MAAEVDKNDGSPGYRRFGQQPPQPTRQKSLRERFFSHGQPPTNRKVYVDHKLLNGDELTEDITAIHSYPNNRVVSSKYTLLTFLPKNLFEQFRRVANFYFLCVALIQFVIDTPVTPLTSILPLLFVISVTAIKQGYEDWLRHKADNEVNLRPAMIVRNGELQTDIRAMDIQVGDIVKVLVNEEFPCDMVMLSSQDPQGQCFVTTANLDGETNLKTHFCVSDTRHFNTPEELGKLNACIECKPPIADLYTFEGVLDIEATPQKPLGPENLLLRGARLRNTPYIFGCAVYTGKDTRMALNSKFKKNKFSRVERRMNDFLITFLVILLVESALATGLKYWYEDNHPWPWYVDEPSSDKKALKVLEHLLAFMVLFNYIIPISLYVTVELQKFLGSIYFGWDIQMYDETIDEPARANTSDLNEELGQVEYLFTDKTGTLTENTMMFRQCCIGTRQFEEVDGKFCEKDGSSINLDMDVEFSREMDEFFKVLVLCHTVRVDRHMQTENPTTIASSVSVYSTTGMDYEYQASSPDEKALVEACCKYGIIYHGNNDDVLEVTFHGEMHRFQLLHTLPFDALRKRMSIIIKDGEKYVLLCKGADVAILDRVVSGCKEQTEKQIDEYAMLGLRTLTIASRILSPQEFEAYDIRLNEARRSLSGRTEKLAEAFNEIEQNLTLLGATAVEDKLQDQVPQTIEALRMAGIKVWVLTGDKEETAVNISHSAGHFHSDMTEHRLTQVGSEEQCDQQLPILMRNIEMSNSGSQNAFIIDGKSLAHAMKERCRRKLEMLCSKCDAVLCCRMSPIQKAEVVAMIKHQKSRPVTAAIGDGANDVSMIQEADVGLGIMGKEGRQAVRTSDYAFGKFRFLRRALLLHGHLYYNRISVLVQYFFYKNIAWITSQLFYAIFSAFSEQSLFDPYFLVFYNLTFTSLPILIYGLFEIHKPKDVLLNNPKLYRAISRNALLCWPQFVKWNLLGLYHCCVVFFGHYFIMWKGVSIFESGKTIGNFDFGSFIVFTSATTVNIKLMLETYYWCLPIFLSYLITIVGNIILTAVYTNVFWPDWMVSTNDMIGVLTQIYSSPAAWFAFLLLVVMALLPDIVLKTVKDTSWSRRIDTHGRVKGVGKSHRGISTLHENRGGVNGYVNPAMSMSSENLPTATGVTKFTTQQGVDDNSNGNAILQKYTPISERSLRFINDQHDSVQRDPSNNNPEKINSQEKVNSDVSSPEKISPQVSPYDSPDKHTGEAQSPSQSRGNFTTIIKVQSIPQMTDSPQQAVIPTDSKLTSPNISPASQASNNAGAALSPSRHNLTTGFVFDTTKDSMSTPPSTPSRAAKVTPSPTSTPIKTANDSPSSPALPNTPLRTAPVSVTSTARITTPSSIQIHENSSEPLPVSPSQTKNNIDIVSHSSNEDIENMTPSHTGYSLSKENNDAARPGSSEGVGFDPFLPSPSHAAPAWGVHSPETVPTDDPPNDQATSATVLESTQF